MWGIPNIFREIISAFEQGNPVRASEIYNIMLVLYPTCPIGSPVDNSLGVINKSLLCCTENCSVSTVKMLLDRGASVTVANQFGRTPLHIAAEHNKVEAARLYLSYGAIVETRDVHNYTAIHAGLLKGHIEIVRLLLPYQDVDTVDGNGETLLNIAVRMGNLDLVNLILTHLPRRDNESNRKALKIAICAYPKHCTLIVNALLNYGISVEPEDVNNDRLLLVAVKRGYLKVVHYLLRYLGDVNRSYKTSELRGATLLHFAAKYKHSEVVRLLLSYGANTNVKDETFYTPLTYAVKNADLNTAKVLLANGADPTSRQELLSIAVKNRCKRLIELLLAYGMDINGRDIYDRTPLLTYFYDECCSNINNNHVSWKQCIEVCKVLLKNGADVNLRCTSSGMLPIHFAVERGDEIIIDILLKAGADINAKDERENTPLHAALKNEDLVVAEFLLKRKAVVNCKNRDGISPLHMAAGIEAASICRLMLENGADVNVTDGDGLTPLYLAAEQGNADTIDVLLDAGADINGVYRNGRTALHVASEMDESRAVLTLIRRGSDINIVDKQGYTAFHIAAENDDFCLNPTSNYDDYRVFDFELHQEYLYERGSIILLIFVQHMMKLSALGLHVNRQDLEMIRFDESMDLTKTQFFSNKCKKEVASMRKAKINKSNVSYYDFLKASARQSVKYMENERIVQGLKRNSHGRRFPLYSSMINNRFKWALERKKSMDESQNFRDFLVNRTGLHCDCVEVIYSYLGNKDLQILGRVC